MQQEPTQGGSAHATLDAGATEQNVSTGANRDNGVFPKEKKRKNLCFLSCLLFKSLLRQTRLFYPQIALI
jgi:hypothetical protein